VAEEVLEVHGEVLGKGDRMVAMDRTERTEKVAPRLVAYRLRVFGLQVMARTDRTVSMVKAAVEAEAEEVIRISGC
jgi:hypothetical protein